MSTTRIAEVIGHRARSAGELRMIADDSGIMSVATDEVGGGVLPPPLPPTRSVSVPPIGPKHDVPVNTKRYDVGSIGASVPVMLNVHDSAPCVAAPIHVTGITVFPSSPVMLPAM